MGGPEAGSRNEESKPVVTCLCLRARQAGRGHQNGVMQMKGEGRAESSLGRGQLCRRQCTEQVPQQDFSTPTGLRGVLGSQMIFLMPEV